MKRFYLLNGATGNVSGVCAIVDRGVYTFVAGGTFDSCTITITLEADGVSISPTDNTLTAAGALEINIGAPVEVKATVSSAGASTDVFCFTGI